jgi:hypothetical protein
MLAITGLLAVVSGQGAAPGVATALAAAPANAAGEAPAADARKGAWIRLRDRLEQFHVEGAVKTEDGLLLPETIFIEIRSEICVESREPGARFWSLDYDTCFVFVHRDTLDENGTYSVSVPSLDADVAVESRHNFGDLRLVPRGPVSFLAESDAGWRHQETFSSSRTQRRDLLLTLDPESFWVVKPDAVFRERPRENAAVHRSCPYGTEIPVIRFYQGWAQARIGSTIGWMEMRFLGTREQMEAGRPFKGKEPVTPVGRGRGS